MSSDSSPARVRTDGCSCFQLWTAPELLRMEEPSPYGTQQGDVYSLGIILQEIVYRALPYFIDTMSPKGECGSRV